MKKTLFLSLVAASLLAGANLYATPSTQIWNPSTDIQPLRTFHAGVDNYFSVANNEEATKRYALGTDMGLEYGVVKNLEIGFDAVEPSADPVYFNVKYGLPESGYLPAFAAGVFNAGTKKDSTDYNIFYGVAAKTFDPVGRISLGYYSGNDKLLVDEKGDKANTGLIGSWDKQLTKKIWASVDYASGNSSYGSFSFGGSYSLADNVSMIIGYVIFNNTSLNPNNTLTTQFDINF